MAFTLKVYVTGLCIFTPVRDEHNEIEEVKILFANARDENRINAVTGDTLIKPHRPLVQYEVRNRVSDSPNYPLFQDSQGLLNGMWFFDDCDLEILGSDDPLVMKTARLDNPVNDGKKFPTVADREDFYWVAPMRDANGNLTQAKPGLIANSVKDPDGDLAARMIVKGGNLKPAAFSANPLTREFLTFDLGVQQAMATMVLIEMEVTGPSVTLRAKSNGSNNSDKFSTLELKPYPQQTKADENGLLEIFILNREVDEVHGQIPPIGALHEGPIRHAQEFLFLEKMLTSSPKRNVDNPIMERPEDVDVEFQKFDGCKNAAMNRIYFPGQGGEGGTMGGVCHPATASGK